MKNIGILVYDISLTGGAEKVAINLCNEFTNKYDVFLISLFNEKQFNNGNNYNFVSLFEQSLNIPMNFFHICKSLREYLINNNIDILLSITAGVNTVAIFSTRKMSTKVIYCEHSNLENKTYGKKHQFRQFIGAKYADAIVTLTNRDKENFINNYKISSNKVFCIPNWFVKNKVSLEYNINSKKIISVGRLEKVKGYDLMIQVAKIIKEKHCEYHWDIYGEGKQKAELEKLILEEKLEDFITLKGNVSNLIQKKIYNDYFLYVMTSYYEGLPLGILEAKTFKLPVISFDCPTGPSELITNGINGYLISCYSIEEMAERIIYLIENNNICREFSNNSQIEFNNYDKQIVLKKWYHLIDNL